MRPLKAIAAMAENRVIGCRNRIPWHLPEDFKWFKQMTAGQVVVMGRKTYESIGRPLPNRANIVLTRSGTQLPGVQVISDLKQLCPYPPGQQIFICGGAEVYRQALPFCTDLYLTQVKRPAHGDAFFPPFEAQFEWLADLLDHPDFKIIHYRNRAPADLCSCCSCG